VGWQPCQPARITCAACRRCRRCCCRWCWANNRGGGAAGCCSIPNTIGRGRHANPVSWCCCCYGCWCRKGLHAWHLPSREGRQAGQMRRQASQGGRPCSFCCSHCCCCWQPRCYWRRCTHTACQHTHSNRRSGCGCCSLRCLRGRLLEHGQGRQPGRGCSRTGGSAAATFPCATTNTCACCCYRCC
jgi:hypothetical protein